MGRVSQLSPFVLKYLFKKKKCKKTLYNNTIKLVATTKKVNKKLKTIIKFVYLFKQRLNFLNFFTLS